ncbi:MAG: hypothetical protein NUK63_04495 [Candidatus Bathyarchaeum tardum]|nr:MAG: hypothetical protein NUK63_04495 [Candidatus Bathyarchaeum tardum]
MIILVALSVIIVVQFFRFGEKDTEWVNDVNAFIEDKKPFPEEPVSSLAIFQFYYNGSLIHHTSNSLDPLVVKITDILNRASWVIESSENRQFLDELLEDSTYLHAIFRSATSFSTEHNVKAAYFILTNDLNPDLKGTVIMYSFTVYANASEKELYSLREVVK